MTCSRFPLFNQPIETSGETPSGGGKFSLFISPGELLADLNDISSVSGDDVTTGSLVTMTTELPTGNLLAGMAGGFDDVMVM